MEMSDQHILENLFFCVPLKKLKRLCNNLRVIFIFELTVPLRTKIMLDNIPFL